MLASLKRSSVQYIDETDEMIWWSERSGWGHFYLYGRDGKVKNAITSGLFRASLSDRLKSAIVYVLDFRSASSADAIRKPCNQGTVCGDATHIGGRPAPHPAAS